jgi:hypothetical protein
VLAPLLGVRLELLLERGELGERRIRIGFAAPLVGRRPLARRPTAATIAITVTSVFYVLRSNSAKGFGKDPHAVPFKLRGQTAPDGTAQLHPRRWKWIWLPSVLLAVVIALLALLVAGLLRSHAEILRALHDRGIEPEPR